MDTETTLVVTAAKNQDAFLRFLTSCGCGELTLVPSANEARRRLSDQEYQLTIISAPLPDEFGRDLALQSAETTNSGVLFIVPSLQSAEVAADLEPYGIAVLPSPMSRQAVTQSLHLLRAARNRLLTLREENRRLVQRLADMKLISQAKCALIQYGGFTEEEAHHTLERRAMDRRISRRQAAQEILSAYEGTPSA